MRELIRNTSKTAIVLFILSCAYLLWHLLRLAGLGRPLVDAGIYTVNVGILNFKTVFLSILIEAIPFVIIGVFISAVLHNFVSEETIRRLLPRSRYWSILLACLLGVIFPVCECGIVPVARRLVMKGVPLYSAVTFMLAAPIINPVVASSTAMAFAGSPEMVWLRLGLAFSVSCLTGLMLSFIFHGRELKADADRHHCGCGCGHHHQHCGRPSFAGRVGGTLQSACDEFFEMGKYLVLGAFLAASAQTFLSQGQLIGIGWESASSILTMMAFAFILSVCSSADAFIAASFNNVFTGGSLLAFMVFGPMVDLKNTLMLINAFRLRFVVLLTFIVAFLVFSGANMINSRLMGG